MRRLLSPTSNANALRELFESMWRYRELVWEMTKRDLFERHSGSVLGGMWVIGQPLLVMLVQTVVFSTIFNVRLGGEYEGTSYVAYLLAGLVPWLVFQEAIGRAPAIITDNKNLVKQIVFPPEILPIKMVLATFVVLVIGLLFPMGIMFLDSGANLLWLAIPLPIISLLLLMIGLSYLLSATAVFLRDIKNVVQLLLMVGLFLHPILYTPEMLPRWGNILFQLSPLSHIIWIYRDILIFGEITHPISWVLAPLSGLIFLVLGFRIFRHLRHAFGDVL